MSQDNVSNRFIDSDNDSTEPRPRPKAIRRQTLPTRPPMPGHVQPPLSKTEKKVMCLLLRSMTEREVAQELGRSHNTVHVHTRNIYRKLGVTTRKMLFQYAAANPGVVTDEDPGQQHQAAA